MGTTSRKDQYIIGKKHLKDVCDTRNSKILIDEREKKKAPLSYRQERFHQRRTELIFRGTDFEEIKRILLEEYPDFVTEKLKLKITLPDGTESNAFDIQLKDQIRKIRGNSQGDNSSKRNESDGR